jgi:hypothetical protein
MKIGGIFWGTFLLGTGALFLLKNFGVPAFGGAELFKYWPLALILFGAAFLMENRLLKGLFTGGSAALVAVIAWTTVWQIPSMIETKVENLTGTATVVTHQTLSEAYDSSIARARLDFDGGIGELKLGGTTDNAIDLEAETNIGDYRLKRKRKNDVEIFTVKLSKQKFFSLGNVENTVRVKLNPLPLWDVNCDIGAASADLDFSAYKLEKLSIDAGAASIDLKLGDLATETRVRLRAGAASVDIKIPKSVGCEVLSDAAIASEDFNGFQKSGKRYYTDNFQTSAKKIYIDVDAGVSSINITRY